MANKRQLKRKINYITSELFAEAMATVIYSAKDIREEGDNLLTSIIITRDDFISRVSHPEPGMKPKKYYRALADAFNGVVSETIDNIGNLG